MHVPASPTRRACGRFRGAQSAVEYRPATLGVARPGVFHATRSDFSDQEHMAVYVRSESDAYCARKANRKVSADLMLKFVILLAAPTHLLTVPVNSASAVARCFTRHFTRLRVKCA